MLAFTAFSRERWSNIWSTNPLERVNKEIKRRTRVVGIFPKRRRHTVGAVLIDTHDEWDRRPAPRGLGLIGLRHSDPEESAGRRVDTD